MKTITPCHVVQVEFNFSVKIFSVGNSKRDMHCAAALSALSVSWYRMNCSNVPYNNKNMEHDALEISITMP